MSLTCSETIVLNQVEEVDEAAAASDSPMTFVAVTVGRLRVWPEASTKRTVVLEMTEPRGVTTVVCVTAGREAEELVVEVEVLRPWRRLTRLEAMAAASVSVEEEVEVVEVVEVEAELLLLVVVELDGIVVCVSEVVTVTVTASCCNGGVAKLGEMLITGCAAQSQPVVSALGPPKWTSLAGMLLSRPMTV